jgi:AcrR family transcriptional regulator
MARPRSASAHEKVLRAAGELFAERGIEGASMDAIAAMSGVSKATIYKHWADKEALLLEVLAEMSGVRGRPSFDSGNTRADILAVLSYHPPQDAGLRERLLPHLISYSATHREFGHTWRSKVMEPPRRELTHLLKLGIRKRELSSAVDMDLSLALLLGPLMYWHIFLRAEMQDPAALAKGVVDSFWRAYGVPKRR